jgi:hypothetical protein
MHFGLLTALTACAIAAASTAEAFSGVIAFFRDVKYSYNLGALKINNTNRCYNLDCGHLDNSVSSVRWFGLPSAAKFDGETRALVAFYGDNNCTGTRQHFQTRWGGVESFSTNGINDIVSSFMILQTSEKIEHGTRSVCALGVHLQSLAR